MSTAGYRLKQPAPPTPEGRRVPQGEGVGGISRCGTCCPAVRLAIRLPLNTCLSNSSFSLSRPCCGRSLLLNAAPEPQLPADLLLPSEPSGCIAITCLFVSHLPSPSRTGSPMKAGTKRVSTDTVNLSQLCDYYLNLFLSYSNLTPPRSA